MEGSPFWSALARGRSALEQTIVGSLFVALDLKLSSKTSFTNSFIAIIKSTNQEPHAAEPDVRVRVRRRVVQVHVEHAGVRCIVPVPTPKDSAHETVSTQSAP